MCPECNCVIQLSDEVVTFEGIEWHYRCWSGEESRSATSAGGKDE